MTDVFSKSKRSEVMSSIRGRGNKDTELVLARVLRANRISGWRRQVVIRINVQRPTSNIERSKLSVGRWKFFPPFTVRPDFVFRQVRLALFVDGCFWHGCPKHATKPQNNRAFWRRKLAGNIARDALVTRTLQGAGWLVLRVWEHELAKKNEPRLMRRIQQGLS